MDTINSVLEAQLNALKAMREDDFSENIIKPLFEAMNYERVDFNGGPNERGRDVIAQYRMPPKKELCVAYIQSKKIGDIQNSRDSAKFSTLIHQLRQCCSYELTTVDGRKCKADDVYLACPEMATNRFIEDVGSQLKGCSPEVVLYDGPQIISDIKTYKPELLNLLTSIKNELTTTCNTELVNKELLSALRSRNKISIENFYTDLNFFVGSIDSNLLFHLKLKVINENINIDKDEWIRSKASIDELGKAMGVCLSRIPLLEIENIYKVDREKFESSENVNNINKLKKMKRDLAKQRELFEEIFEEFSEVTVVIRKKNTEGAESFNVRKYRDCMDSIRVLAMSEGGVEEVAASMRELEDKVLSDILARSLVVVKKIINIKKKIAILTCKIISEPSFLVPLNVEGLIERLDYFKYRYRAGLEAINNGKVGASQVKRFLNETEGALSIATKLTSLDVCISSAIKLEREKCFEDRVSLSPHDIFVTGHDVAVYGGAGVGKTTTLQAYAASFGESVGRVIVYIPLNKLADRFRMEAGGEHSEHLKSLNKDLIIKIMLISKRFEPTEENIQIAINVIPKNITLILDGLDEVYGSIPGIIPAIKEFKNRYKYSQLIVSSRDCVSYLNEIDFLGITLLPFSHDQLNRFVEGWLDDSEKSSRLIKAIEEKGLYEHIKTPLLATIACSLVENGIDAPSSEYEIYMERLNLLTGDYDLHKNISRQRHRAPKLIDSAKKIAYSMHQLMQRSLPKEKMLDILRDSYSASFGREVLSEYLEDLIDPCNILVKDPVSSMYSFGHFRYQEHLVSLELSTNRYISITKLLFEDWWRGALCLYAQENEFSELFEETYIRHGNIGSAYITFDSMIEVADEKKRKGLRELLKRYRESDFMEEFLGDELFRDDVFTYDDDLLD